MNFDFTYPSEQLDTRVPQGMETFQKLYGAAPAVISRAPGRAEVIGNHTDYNNGYALTCGITRSTLTFMKKREDMKVRVASHGYSDEPMEFDLNTITAGEAGHWLNYIKGVFHEMQKSGHKLSGVDILIESNVPSSGGVSSSAAIELSVATALTSLFGIQMSNVEKSFLCKKAENGEIVQVPCGFLDQAAAGLSEKDHLLFLDFQPSGDMPVSKMDQIKLDLGKHNASFVVVVDKEVKRNLGSSGYPARRAMCEKSVPLISEMLGKPMQTLREVSISEFEQCRAKLDAIDPVMRKRVEHIVYENQRVLDAMKALADEKIEDFGKILTASGRSALELYELDEKTPELTKLVTSGRSLEGVLGMRNMGGGFSAIALALVLNDHMESFEKSLNEAYGPGLEFVPFELSQGANIIS